MSLPVWDSDTVLKYKGRWNALKRVGRRFENEPTTNDTSRLILENNAFPEPEDISPPFRRIRVKDEKGQLLYAFIRLGDQYIQAGTAHTSEANGDDTLTTEHERLEYETLHEGLAHLLYTQPNNPPYESLIRHLDGEDNRRACYQEISIPKKRGGERTLAVPHHPLKWLQRSLLTVFTHLFPRHKCAHGFEREKSIVTHAKKHTGKKYVYTIDIKDFFPSITRNRVFGMLQAYPFNAPVPVARYFANLTCYDGSLPQGAPTSPILSNLLCRRLDSRLFKWARQNGYTYSRYADDLTFSTNSDSFPESDIAFIDDVIRDEGFEVNEEKRRLQPYYKRQMVTGLVVNEKVNLPREKLRGLRALLHNIEHHGWRSQVNRTSIFDDAEEWRSYINADLSRSEFKKVEKRQRDEHKLLNPAAALPQVEDEDDLREVVRGRVAFVGAVRGDDDNLYQNLLNKFNKLSNRLTRFQKKSGIGKGQKSKNVTSDEGKKKSKNGLKAEKRRKNKHWRNISKWIGELEKEESEISVYELREKISTWKEYSVEAELFLRTHRKVEIGQNIEKAKRIAYVIDISPEDTYQFLLKMEDQDSFKGLLHPPTDKSVSPEEIIGKCERHFKKHKNKIPNKLKDETNEIIEKCKEWVESNEGKYPWPKAGKETKIKDKLKEYKENTRIDHGDIEDILKEEAEILSEKYGVEFEFPMYGTSFRTHVPSVKPALTRIISSMAKYADRIENASSKISIDTTLNKNKESLSELEIQISNKGSFFERTSNLEVTEIMRGNLTDSLYHDPTRTGLRGYAKWHILSPFDDGKVRKIDITGNDIYGSYGEENIEGVNHKLLFPRVQ